MLTVTEVPFNFFFLLLSLEEISDNCMPCPRLFFREVTKICSSFFLSSLTVSSCPLLLMDSEYYYHFPFRRGYLKIEMANALS